MYLALKRDISFGKTFLQVCFSTILGLNWLNLAKLGKNWLKLAILNKSFFL